MQLYIPSSSEVSIVKTCDCSLLSAE